MTSSLSSIDWYISPSILRYILGTFPHETQIIKTLAPHMSNRYSSILFDQSRNYTFVSTVILYKLVMDQIWK